MIQGTANIAEEEILEIVEIVDDVIPRMTVDIVVGVMEGIVVDPRVEKTTRLSQSGLVVAESPMDQIDDQVDLTGQTEDVGVVAIILVMQEQENAKRVDQEVKWKMIALDCCQIYLRIMALLKLITVIIQPQIYQELLVQMF